MEVMLTKLAQEEVRSPTKSRSALIPPRSPPVREPPWAKHALDTGVKRATLEPEAVRSAGSVSATIVGLP